MRRSEPPNHDFAVDELVFRSLENDVGDVRVRD